LLTIPLVDAHETRSLGRSLLAQADAKKLPKRLHAVVAALRTAFTALEKKLQRRTMRAGAEQGSPGRDDADVRADRLLAVMHGVLASFARLPDGDVDPARAEAASALLAALYPEGLAAIVQATHKAQYERMRDFFSVADHKKAGHAARVEAVGLKETLAALRALLPEYAKLAGVLATSGSDEPEYVRDEMLALREAITTYARRVDGDAAGGERNAELRAQRLLRPLRAVDAQESERRAAGKGAKSERGDAKKEPAEEKK